MKSSRARLMAILALAVTIYVSLAAMLPEVSSRWVDSAWFVRVCSRMMDGETLYRDVFCGTTPLAFVIQRPAMQFVDDGFLLLRVTVHGLFALTLLLTAATAELLGIERRVTVAALALACVWMTPVPGSAYSWWALTFFAATQCAAASWSKRGSWQAALAAGVLSGLAFCAKPNVGFLALAAVLVSMTWVGFAKVRADGTLRHAGLAVSGFAAMTGLCLLAVAASGAWAWFVSQCFTGKSVYLSQAGISYTGLFWQALTGSGVRSTIYLMPLCLPMLWWFGRRGSNPVAILSVFALTGLAGAFPRPDGEHIFLAAPAFALVAGAVAAVVVPNQRMTLAAAALALAALNFWTAVGSVTGTREPFRESAQILERHAPGGTLFVLHPAAPLIYTSTVLKNPTRYDYPMMTTFGPGGQQEVIRDIEAGRIPAICMRADSPAWMGMAPRVLMQYVEERLRPGPDLGLCRIYTP